MDKGASGWIAVISSMIEIDINAPTNFEVLKGFIVLHKIDLSFNRSISV
jgi:hypothetical protein